MTALITREGSKTQEFPFRSRLAELNTKKSSMTVQDPSVEARS